MRLVRHGAAGAERPGVLDPADADTILDLAPHVRDVDGRLLAEGGLEWLRARLADRAWRARLARIPAGAVRLGPPIATPSKLIAVGVNYLDHSAETGVKAPDAPVLFAKAVSAIIGPNDPIVIPRGYATVDFEVELAVVLGARTKDVGEDEARAAIAGYVVMNDVSERTVQKQGALKQWFRGKSFDTFAPLGPWFVTADEVPDPHALDLSLDLNGERMQESNTRHMLFRCERLIQTAADGMTLLPGGVISTGTPHGVGFTRTPPRYLAPGDHVTATVQGLGSQNCPVRAS